MRKRPLPYDAERARKHLMRADPVMRDLVKRVGAYKIEVRGQPYEALLRSVLYQQLAGAAAAAIERRFLALYDGTPAPEQLLATPDDALRAAGLSRQKAGYLRSIAEHFGNGHLNNRALLRADDDTVIEQVTQIKGIGRWTADMLLMFCLGRPDILPVGDFGIRASMMAAYGLSAMPTPREMMEIAEPWRPYRSAGSWYLWARADTLTL